MRAPENVSRTRPDEHAGFPRLMCRGVPAAIATAMVSLAASACTITAAAEEGEGPRRAGAEADGGGHKLVLGPPFSHEVLHEDLYGDELPSGAVMRLGTIRLRNRARTEGVAFSSDGRLLASGGQAVRVFDATSGRMLREVTRLSPAGGICTIAFSPGGRRIATGNRNGHIRVYAIKDGTEVFAGRHSSDGIPAIAFLPDGRTLASFGGDGNVRMWDVVAGKETRTFQHNHGRGSREGQLAVSPDGRLIAAAADERISIWDVETGAAQTRIAKPHENPVTALAFAPGGDSLLSGGTRSVAPEGNDPRRWPALVLSQIRLWNVKSGEMQRELLTDEPGRLLELIVPEMGDTLIAATRSRAFYLGLSTGEVRRTIELPGISKWERGEKLALSPRGDAVAIAAGQSAVHVVDLQTGELSVPLSDAHTELVRAVEWSADGRFLVTGSGDGSVRIWDPVSSRSLRRLEFSDRCMNLYGVAISPDGEFIAAAGDHNSSPAGQIGLVKVWRARSGRLVLAAEAVEGFFNVAFSSDSQLLAAARFTEDRFGAGPPQPRGAIDIYRTDNSGQKLITLVEQDRTATGLAFTSDDASLVAVARDGTIRRWNVASGALERTDTAEDRVTATISPRGTELVTGTYKIDRATRTPIYTLTVRSLHSGEVLHTMEGRSGFGAHALDISSDGKLLVAGSHSEAITVWSMDTGEKLLELASPQATIVALAFDPSGRHVVTGMDDGTAVVWDVSRAGELAGGAE